MHKLINEPTSLFVYVIIGIHILPFKYILGHLTIQKQINSKIILKTWFASFHDLHCYNLIRNSDVKNSNENENGNRNY